MVPGKTLGAWISIPFEYGHNKGEVVKLANSEGIQSCIDSCTETANGLRLVANTMLCAMERQSATLGAAQIEMCINSLVNAKTLI